MTATASAHGRQQQRRGSGRAAGLRQQRCSRRAVFAAEQRWQSGGRAAEQRCQHGRGKATAAWGGRH